MVIQTYIDGLPEAPLEASDSAFVNSFPAVISIEVASICAARSLYCSSVGRSFLGMPRSKVYHMTASGKQEVREGVRSSTCMRQPAGRSRRCISGESIPAPAAAQPQLDAQKARLNELAVICWFLSYTTLLG